MPVLKASKASAKRQKTWQQDPAQPSISDFLPQRSDPQPSEPQSSELEEPDQAMQMDSTCPPPPMPVRTTPHSQPAQADSSQAQQQQHQQQQQHSSLSQHDHVNGPVDAAQEAAERFQRSVSQQVVQALPCQGQGLNATGAVGLQGCLHRFVHPETLSRWTCSRSDFTAAHVQATLGEPSIYMCYNCYPGDHVHS